MLKKTLHAMLTICVLLALSALPAAALQKGDDLPELKGTTIDGVAFDLSSFKGEPILLKIGTTWCPTCKIQTKAINNLSEYLKENNVHFVDVFLQESEKTVRKYFSKGKYQTPETVLIDDGQIYKALNIYLIPRVILIDKNFKVFRDSAALSEKKLKLKLEALLATQ